MRGFIIYFIIGVVSVLCVSILLKSNPFSLIDEDCYVEEHTTRGSIASDSNSCGVRAIARVSDYFDANLQLASLKAISAESGGFLSFSQLQEYLQRADLITEKINLMHFPKYAEVFENESYAMIVHTSQNVGHFFPLIYEPKNGFSLEIDVGRHSAYRNVSEVAEALAEMRVSERAIFISDSQSLQLINSAKGLLDEPKWQWENELGIPSKITTSGIPGEIIEIGIPVQNNSRSKKLFIEKVRGSCDCFIGMEVELPLVISPDAGSLLSCYFRHEPEDVKVANVKNSLLEIYGKFEDAEVNSIQVLVQIEYPKNGYDSLMLGAERNLGIVQKLPVREDFVFLFERNHALISDQNHGEIEIVQRARNGYEEKRLYDYSYSDIGMIEIGNRFFRVLVLTVSIDFLDRGYFNTNIDFSFNGSGDEFRSSLRGFLINQ